MILTLTEDYCPAGRLSQGGGVNVVGATEQVVSSPCDGGENGVCGAPLV